MYPMMPGQAPNMWDRMGNAAGFDPTWGSVQRGGAGQQQAPTQGAPGGMWQQAPPVHQAYGGQSTPGGASGGNPLASMYGFGSGAMIGGSPQMGGGSQLGNGFGMPAATQIPSGGMGRTMPVSDGRPMPRSGGGRQLPGAGTTGGMPAGVSTPGGGMGGGPPQGSVFQGIAPMMGGGGGGVALPGAGTTDQGGGEVMHPGGRRDNSAPRQATDREIGDMQKMQFAPTADQLAQNQSLQGNYRWSPGGQNSSYPGMVPSQLQGGMFSGDTQSVPPWSPVMGGSPSAASLFDPNLARRGMFGGLQYAG